MSLQALKKHLLFFVYVLYFWRTLSCFTVESAFYSYKWHQTFFDEGLKRTSRSYWPFLFTSGAVGKNEKVEMIWRSKRLEKCTKWLRSFSNVIKKSSLRSNKAIFSEATHSSNSNPIRTCPAIKMRNRFSVDFPRTFTFSAMHFVNILRLPCIRFPCRTSWHVAHMLY